MLLLTAVLLIKVLPHVAPSIGTEFVIAAINVKKKALFLVATQLF